MLAASYAKINLFLEVSAKLPNNYHQVNTVLSSIDLCDYLSFEPLPSPEIKFSCNNPELSSPNNLVYRVASYLLEHYSPKLGVSINLDKRIPIAAGLGGGSSNAASCIKALNLIWNLGLDDAELHKIAAMFGSDINFFLEGGTALGQNRGEQISPIPDIMIADILLVNPNIAISSAEAYHRLTVPSQHQLRTFDPDNLKSTCFNRLESGIRKAYAPIDNLLNDLSEHGAYVAMLSGSGATCFGFFEDGKEMQACRRAFIARGFWTLITKTLSREQLLSNQA
jgi:4-diphosphocytidyl-2-C-methyl-D-erythritol kinase